MYEISETVACFDVVITFHTCIAILIDSGFRHTNVDIYLLIRQTNMIAIYDDVYWLERFTRVTLTTFILFMKTSH